MGNGQQSQLQCDDEVAKIILSNNTGKKQITLVDQLTFIYFDLFKE